MNELRERSKNFKRIGQQPVSGNENLPEPVQKISKKNFNLFKINPTHPSLRFKKVGEFWSVRIGMNHRVLAVEYGNDFIWVWIGNP